MSGSHVTPRDEFPPFGYLSTPWHTWKLNPSGVVRSRPPAGMGWHVPNYGSYGRNQFSDRAHLYAGIEAAGTRLLTTGDCAAARVAVSCDLHTQNRLRYVLHHPADPHLSATYFLLEEHAVGCNLELTCQRAARIRLWLAQELAHNSATSRLWEHGFYAAPPGAAEPATGTAGIQGICPEGAAWAFALRSLDGADLAPSDWRVQVGGIDGGDQPDVREPAELQRQTAFLAYDLDVPAGEPLVLHALLARGLSADTALLRVRTASEAFAPVLAAREEEDERFWAHAPRLTGDWPAHWRRGLVGDVETLRMVVRPPAGVFARAWDGMQAQAPRSVLAETALDALALSWADIALARDILLHCFAAAPRPNVPCMREDGSYNMVADDGAPCGTGPEWGYPLAIADTLYRRSEAAAARAWLAELYPHAAAYIEWWLTHRTDDEGWLVHACSWESGQDVSARFGEQRTGGSNVRHLRPVDLHAAAAQGSFLLADWAQRLARPPEEVARWREESRRLAAKTHAMWRGGWYRDLDTRAGRASDVRDPMQLAPLACRVSTPNAEDDLRASFDALPPHGGVWPPLAWPPVAHTVLEAATAIGLHSWASERAYTLLDRAWLRSDSRELEPDGAIPGVTREFWPEEGSAGIECYGWGGLTVHFLVTYLVGLRMDTPQSFRLIPALPGTWRIPGATYGIGPLPWGAGALLLTYCVPDSAPDVVDVEVTTSGVAGPLQARDAETNAELASVVADADGAAHLAWRGAWLREVVVRSAASDQ